MTIEQKALELVNAVRTERGMSHDNCINRAIDYDEALCRALEAHKADNARHAAELREQAERFSEAAREAIEIARLIDMEAAFSPTLSPFILAPVDPLVEECRRIAEHLLALNAAPASDEDTIALMVKAMLKAPSAIVKKEAV